MISVNNLFSINIAFLKAVQFSPFKNCSRRPPNLLKEENPPTENEVHIRGQIFHFRMRWKCPLDIKHRNKGRRGQYFSFPLSILKTNLVILFSLFFSHAWSQEPADFYFVQRDGKYQLVAEIYDKTQVQQLQSKAVKKQEALQVYVGTNIHNQKNNYPTVLGAYSFSENKLYFAPRFSFNQDLTYTAILFKKDTIEFSLPVKQNRPISKVEAIFPSVDTLPANLLKMYLYFSHPMRQGEAYQNILLTNEEGTKVFEPFLELIPELWDSERKRLTLWFDPGRVKRALGPNTSMGTPLEKGKRYTLRILNKWKDAFGQEMEHDFIKQFYVGEDDRHELSLADWTIFAPKPATKKPLKINFGEALDHAVALKSFQILDAFGKEIKGAISLNDNDMMLSFSPSSDWKSGDYRIQVDAILEDLAGNNLNRLFDRDLEKAEEARNQQFYTLEFTIE